jgi:hypothetical protein
MFAVVAPGLILLVLKQKPFQKSAHFPGDITPVNRRAENQAVRTVDFFKDGLQIVTEGAVTQTVSALFAARHTAAAAFEIQIVQVDELHLCTGTSGTLQRLVEKNVRVPALPWTSTDSNYFHTFSPQNVVSVDLQVHLLYYIKIKYESTHIFVS